MDWSAIAVATLFGVLGLVCLLLIPLGLPGTWILLALAVLVELADGLYLANGEAVTFGWKPLGLGVGLAVLGEVIEAVAGAAGAKWGGATRRGLIGAFVGGIAGAIVLTGFIPIPLVGTLIGALLGTFVGALVGEITAEKRRDARKNVRAAAAAAIGRLAGTLGKLAIGIVVWAYLVRAAFLAPSG